MSGKDLSKYEVGQEVWFIKTFDNHDKPIVESAVITRKMITIDKNHTWVQVEYKDSAHIYRTAPYTPIYSTKKAAGKDLKKVYKEQLERTAKRYEEKVKTLSAGVQMRQWELEAHEEALAWCQKILEELK